jgi:transcriptional regulator with XRE-family HTH domain
MTVDGGNRAVRDHPAGRDRRGLRAATAYQDNPAIQGRRLRAALRQARQDAELTLEQVATALDVSASKIVRIESGTVKVSTTDLKALLDLYKVTDPRRMADFVSMARAARQHPWWRKYREVASPRYLEYVELEQAAVSTLNFQPLVAPGLLQTREYAQAVIRRLAPDASDDQVNARVEFRLDRQERLLDAPEPPKLSFIFDESVMYRQVGDAEVMEEQIRHLIELAGRQNITIQILPFAAGLGPNTQAPFVVVKFADSADPDVLYLEGPSGGTLIANDEEVARYRAAFDELRRLSLSGSDTLKLLRGVPSGPRK